MLKTTVENYLSRTARYCNWPLLPRIPRILLKKSTVCENSHSRQIKVFLTGMERKQLFLKIKFAFFCWIQLNFSTLFSDGSFCSWIWHSYYSLQALLSFALCLFWVNLKLCWRRKISDMASAKTTLFSNNLETVILLQVYGWSVSLLADYCP